MCLFCAKNWLNTSDLFNLSSTNATMPGAVIIPILQVMKHSLVCSNQSDVTEPQVTVRLTLSACDLQACILWENVSIHPFVHLGKADNLFDDEPSLWQCAW